MATKTRTLTVGITERQYEELEELVDRRKYALMDEFIKELIREKFDDFISYIHQKAERDREKHIPLEVYGKSRGLEQTILYFFILKQTCSAINEVRNWKLKRNGEN